MIASVFSLAIAVVLSVQAVVGAPSESTSHSTNTTLSARATTPTLNISFATYPGSAENICYDWYCNGGPKMVHPARGSASANRKANSCGSSSTNRCSTKKGHAAGYQCDEWPRASAKEGGSKAATRCIPGPDNGGSGSVWGNFINNKGPQAVGRVINDGDPVVVNVIDVDQTKAKFCLGISGTMPSPADCKTAAAGQPSLQQIG